MVELARLCLWDLLSLVGVGAMRLERRPDLCRPTAVRVSFDDGGVRNAVGWLVVLFSPPLRRPIGAFLYRDRSYQTEALHAVMFFFFFF